MSKTATCVPSSLMEITAGRELLQAFKTLISFRKRAVFFLCRVCLTVSGIPFLSISFTILLYLVCWEIFLGMTQVWRLGMIANSENRGNILTMPEFIPFHCLLKIKYVNIFLWKKQVSSAQSVKTRFAQKVVLKSHEFPFPLLNRRRVFSYTVFLNHCTQNSPYNSYKSLIESKK